jgi:hypothetical protein
MNKYKRHRLPPDIISYAAWLYYRFNPRRVVTVTAEMPDHSSKIYWPNKASLSAAKRFVSGASSSVLCMPED